MSNQPASTSNDHAMEPAEPSRPGQGESNRCAWLLVSTDAEAQITSWKPLAASSAPDHEIESTLAALGASPDWAKTDGQQGPQTGQDQRLWRAQWTTLEPQHADKAPNKALAISHDPAQDYRLVHLETDTLISGDVAHWLDRCPDIVIGRDAQGDILFVNTSGTALHDTNLIESISEMPHVSMGAERQLDEICIQNDGKHPRYFQRTLMPSPFDMPIEDFVLAHEITSRKEQENALGDNEQLMRMLVDATPDFIAIKDGQGRWVLANDAAQELYQLHAQPWWGKTDAELANLVNRFYAEGLKTFSDSDELAWNNGNLFRRIETIKQQQGGERIFDVIKMPVFDPTNRRKALIIIGRDITERHEAENRYRQLANHDELTGLLNRRFFQEEVDRLLSADGADASAYALILIDLDQFKAVNDRLSHDRGDWLLARIADRLEQYHSQHPEMLVARMGGDEFALLVPTGNTPDGTDASLEQHVCAIAECIKQPFALDGLTLAITASMGIARAPQDGTRIVTLLRAADSAVYEAKSQGRDNHAYYSLELAEKQAWRANMLTALRSGLFENRFQLHFQVQQNARSLAISGVEALLRWSPPSQNLAAGPDQFIPLLEESGLIIEVGNWVLQTACRQAVQWGRQLGEHITMAVNVSSLQLHAPGFVEQVQAALRDSGLDPSQLELELTESALVSDPDKAASTLSTLKALGVKLSLDDFGTGYSSLSYLTRFSFDRLKIDKSFVADLLTDPNDLEVVKAIIAMGHALGLDVIAEGVERVIERDMLESLGCDYFQGYLVGRPGVPEQISPLLGVGLL